MTLIKILKKFFNNLFRSEPKKQIVEYKNPAGEKYWEIIFNGRSTRIHWNSYKDALFYYHHIKRIPTKHYVYEYTESCPFYVLYLDKCHLYVVPADERSRYSYSDICSDSHKYVIFLHDYRRNSLETYYNNVISHDYWESKVILSNEYKEIEKEIDLSISNNDIRALQKIIKEYSDSVKLSQIVAEKLCNNMSK